MTHSYIAEAALLFLGWIVVVQIKNWARWRSLKRLGDANGCGAVTTLPNKLPGGLDRLIVTVMAGEIPTCLLTSRLSAIYCHEDLVLGLSRNRVSRSRGF